MKVSKKKLAIISSYDVLCGNATYADALATEFRKNFEVVDVIALDYQILASANLTHLAATHIKEIKLRIQKYDYVNIQFEAGLYGYSVRSIAQNVLSILDACGNNVIFTIHRMDNFYSLYLLRELYLYNFSIVKLLKKYRALYASRYVFSKIFLSLNKKKNAHVVVHTKKAETEVRRIFGYDKVKSFPITFLNNDSRKYLKNNRLKIREDFLKKYHLAPDKKYIGAFGFITSNKGHIVLLESMKYLSSKYHVLIFGGQHPSAIAQKQHSLSSRSDQYITTLYSSVSKIQSSNITFLGSIDNHDQLVENIAAVDFVALPYFETGQNGSGIAAIALECESNIIASEAIMFSELEKFYKKSFYKTVIGNYVELAQTIQRFVPGELQQNISESVNKYNIENNIKMQIEMFLS